MASLTQTAVTSRKAVRFTIYFIIFLFVGRIVLNIAIGIAQKIFPAPPPPPTVKFGVLPRIAFPDQKELKFPKFRLETPDGELPSLPTQMKVYKIEKPASNLLALDTAKTKAFALGFQGEPEEVSTSIYKFTKILAPAVMQMNIINNTFTISYDLVSDPTPLETRPPTAEQAKSTAQGFLSSGGILPKQLSEGVITNQYLKTENRKLIPALSLSDANFVKVNFFKKDFDKFPSVSKSPFEANVWLILSGDTNREKQVIAGQYYFFPVDETLFSTYPLKTAKEAFDDLQQNKAFIANNVSTQEVALRKIYLAYFDSGTAEDFYQPVIVFEGDSNFVAYVPAVSGQYYSN